MRGQFKSINPSSDLYPFLIWAIFILGTGEAVFVLFKPIYFLVASGLQAIVFVTYVWHLLPGKNKTSKIITSTAACLVFTILFKTAFLYFVWMDLHSYVIFLNLSALTVFILSIIVAAPFILKLQNGTN